MSETVSDWLYQILLNIPYEIQHCPLILAQDGYGVHQIE